ncbi:MAG: hypothetical protein WCL02_09830 [bacterium]
MISILFYYFKTKQFKFQINAIFAFWSAYILTRPLGASIGDYLTQAPKYGGLGISTVWISAIFFIAIVGLVNFLSIKQKNQTIIDA